MSTSTCMAIVGFSGSASRPKYFEKPPRANLQTAKYPLSCIRGDSLHARADTKRSLVGDHSSRNASRSTSARPHREDVAACVRQDKLAGRALTLAFAVEVSMEELSPQKVPATHPRVLFLRCGVVGGCESRCSSPICPYWWRPPRLTPSDYAYQLGATIGTVIFFGTVALWILLWFARTRGLVLLFCSLVLAQTSITALVGLKFRNDDRVAREIEAEAAQRWQQSEAQMESFPPGTTF